jgi:alanine racemase
MRVLFSPDLITPDPGPLTAPSVALHEVTMPLEYNKIETIIHLDRVRSNHRLIKGWCANPIPVVKADAYGHGLIEVAGVLAEEGAGSLAVGTVEEGVRLRRTYGGEIIALLGTLDGEDCRMAWEWGIVPVVHHMDQFEGLAAAAQGRTRLPVALKFDTGMSRLGFAPDQAGEILAALAEHPELNVQMICSHLACADDPREEEFVREQGQRFHAVCALFRKGGVPVRACLANSGGILAYPGLHHDAQRPGIALYGSNPFLGTAWEERGSELRPAMEVTAPVFSVHRVAAGESVSYGRTFRAQEGMEVAVIGAGYADNYSRSLSNRGEVLLHGRRAPVLGRVCMQLTAVDVTRIPGTRVGDRAHLLGGEGAGAITPEELAGWWGTITYEVFCLLGQNRRKHLW